MITPIRINLIAQRRQNRLNSDPKRNIVSFCASDIKSDSAPLIKSNSSDFVDINKGLVKTSAFFRRGSNGYSNNEAFKNIIDAIKPIFSSVSKPKLLIVGVANAEEPFSYLTAIKDFSGNKPLEELVDLHCVDLQSKISSKDLEQYAYFGFNDRPAFAKDCFERVAHPYYPSESLYQVKHEIIKHLDGVFNDSEKTKWNTDIVDFSSQCQANKYDIVSINNVLYYLADESAQASTLENITRMLKKGGVLVTDPKDNYYR